MLVGVVARTSPDDERRAAHASEVHPTQVLAENPEAQQLDAREERDRRGKKSKSGDIGVAERESDDHVNEKAEAERRADETQHADPSQGACAVSGDHVDRV
jgi:hypothetical protein